MGCCFHNYRVNNDYENFYRDVLFSHPLRDLHWDDLIERLHRVKDPLDRYKISSILIKRNLYDSIFKKTTDYTKLHSSLIQYDKNYVIETNPFSSLCIETLSLTSNVSKSKVNALYDIASSMKKELTIMTFLEIIKNYLKFNLESINLIILNELESIVSRSKSKSVMIDSHIINNEFINGLKEIEDHFSRSHLKENLIKEIETDINAIVNQRIGKSDNIKEILIERIDLIEWFQKWEFLFDCMELRSYYYNRLNFSVVKSKK